MFRSLALLSLSAFAVLASPVPDYDVKDIPEQYKGEKSDPAVGAGLRDRAERRGQGDSQGRLQGLQELQEEAIAALKAKSATLGAKAEELNKALKEKIYTLGEEAKTFATDIITEGRKLHSEFLAGSKPSLDDLKAKALSYFDKYHALSGTAKADLEKNFPLTAGLFKNEQVQALINQHLKKN